MEARRASPQSSYPFQLSLRIRHPSIDPEQVSRQLGIEAEHSFRAGEPREAGRSMVAPVHAESYWLGTLDPATLLLGTAFDLGLVPGMSPHTHAMALGALDSALVVLIGSVLRRQAEFFHRLQSEGGEVRLIVAISARKARGFTLTPHLGKALSDLRIPVDFELTHR
ncbi:MAG TPA: hypothetical protein VGQ22_16475 [Steroidobacteraceae bacterium]|jgi:hypothetical protein|nr:hypothetical protein [Steroidobacteraceae bacterium]